MATWCNNDAIYAMQVEQKITAAYCRALPSDARLMRHVRVKLFEQRQEISWPCCERFYPSLMALRLAGFAMFSMFCVLASWWCKIIKCHTNSSHPGVTIWSSKGRNKWPGKTWLNSHLAEQPGRRKFRSQTSNIWTELDRYGQIKRQRWIESRERTMMTWTSLALRPYQPDTTWLIQPDSAWNLIPPCIPMPDPVDHWFD